MWYLLLLERVGVKSGVSEVMCEKFVILGKFCFKVEIYVVENILDVGMYGFGVFVLNLFW